MAEKRHDSHHDCKKKVPAQQKRHTSRTVIPRVQSGRKLLEQMKKCNDFDKAELDMISDGQTALIPLDAPSKAIAKHEAYQDKADVNKYDREKKEYVDIIAEVCGGRVLRGIKKGEHGYFCEREIVLANPKYEEVRIFAPIENYEENIIEINSKSASFKYDATKNHFGCKAAASVSGSLLTKSASAAYSQENKQSSSRTAVENKDDVYHELILYINCPLKCCQIDRFSLTFSKDATKRLEQIAANLSNNYTKKASDLVIEFYDIFGTHINIAKIHLGGTYELKTTYEASASQTSKDYKKETSEAMNAALEVAYGPVHVGGHFQNVASDASRSKTSTFSSSSAIKTRVKKYGGPLECGNIQEWRNELAHNKSLWTIIDFGHPDDVWPIYKMITDEHALPKDFKNKIALQDFLKLHLVQKPEDIYSVMKMINAV